VGTLAQITAESGNGMSKQLAGVQGELSDLSSNASLVAAK